MREDQDSMEVGMTDMIDTEKLRTEPYIIDGASWYYEDTKGIEVIHRRGPNDYIHITVPWFKLLRSVRRYQDAVVRD